MLFGTRERHVKRILIVEDEPLVAFDNETMVANAGYTVVATVDSVREALAILERETEGGGDEAAQENLPERGIDLVLTT
jgi:CheY-like chemotaxis protein